MSAEPVSTSIEGRRIIVTGAGNGLGLAIAQRLARGGAKLLLADRDPVVLDRAHTEEFPKGSVRAIVKDLAHADAAPVVFDAALAALGSVDALINNAAWSLHKPILEMTVAEFDELIAANQRAPYFLAQEFYRHVSQGATKPRDPAIVNIGSVNALVGNPNLIAYTGTKGALVSMTRSMAVEMMGVRVNCINPGLIDTPMARKVFEDGALDPTTIFDKYLIQRMAKMEEIAELVAYLLSPAAAYITGANWTIDGGYTVR
jgi:NAD(P)-dependent dehydrogenase (short-subunit alcohol dehydrogenase family)